MQRWIIALAVLAVPGTGGLYFAYKQYKETRPAAMWVEMPLKGELDEDKKEALRAELEKQLAGPEVTEKIAADLGLARRWKLSGHQEAAAELQKRMFVRFGYMSNHPMGDHVPALHVGVNGIVREREFSGKIAEALFQEIVNRQK